MTPLFTSFATVEYVEEAHGLIDSMEAFGLEYKVCQLRSLGSWESNCAQKSKHILEMRAIFPDRPIVWLDADARVVQNPILFFNLPHDFAAHWLGGRELLSGTLFFANTPAANKLLFDWKEECESKPKQWDQISLKNAVQKQVGLASFMLPPEYTWIDGGENPDISEQHYGKRDPVVFHRQASRRLKAAI